MSSPNSQLAEQTFQTIHDSLDLDELDTNLHVLFRSKDLWMPLTARGVFGGQVIAQAIAAATRVSDKAFGLHSMHCYFLLAGDAGKPILYYVEPLRIGKSYRTYSVHARQSGRVIFHLTCSFSLPEPRQPHFSAPFPTNLPPPEECPLNEERWSVFLDANRERLLPRIREDLAARIQERKESPVAIAFASRESYFDESGRTIETSEAAWWVKARGDAGKDVGFQKAIIAYMSDFSFIGTVGSALGMGQSRRLGMMSSLDHSLWFYDNNFNASEWLLFTMSVPRAGHGRGVVFGQIWTRDGRLICLASQEGVVREALPKDDKAKL